MISVIIPAINEERSIKAAIRSASTQLTEVIVVDGGSTDATREVASESGARVLDALPGRARQMNQGAIAAAGDTLLFLHADCLLPVGFDNQIVIRRAQSASKVGIFSQRIDAVGFPYRMLEFGNRFRTRYFGLGYGDQGIWIARDLFDEIGRFEEVPLMEDFLLSRRLRARGVRMVILPGPIQVSPRRWQKHGVIRQTLRNWGIIFRYQRGVPLDTLATIYRRHDQSSAGGPHSRGSK